MAHLNREASAWKPHPEDFRVRSLVPVKKPPIKRERIRTAKPKTKRPSLKGIYTAPIIEAVAAAYDLEPSDLSGSNRKGNYVQARHTAIKLIRDLRMDDGSPRFSTPQIGKVFKRDHSTIVHALDVFEIKLRQFPFMREIYDELRAEFIA